MPRDQSSTAKMARDNDNRKGGDKLKRRGNHNQGGNRNNFLRPCGQAKQSSFDARYGTRPDDFRRYG